MNKVITLLLAMILCISLTACREISEFIPDKESSYLDNSDQDITQEENTLLNQDSILFVDRQGTNDVYSSLSILNNDDSYAVEMILYRIGYFSGTAKETQGMLCFTCDQGITGIIQFKQDQAYFEVTESFSNLVAVGDVWVFGEREEDDTR